MPGIFQYGNCATYVVLVSCLWFERECSLAVARIAFQIRGLLNWVATLRLLQVSLRYSITCVWGRCCRTLTVEDSHRESMRLDGLHEQAITRPLSHDELVQLHGFSAQARIAADLAGQGDGLARAA